MNLKLLNLLHLADNTLPIGGFSHSSGLETYVQKKIVHDTVSATDFIQQMLMQNICNNDAAFASLAYDCAFNKNMDILVQLDNECTALKLPTEIRTASKMLGLRLCKIFQPFHQTQHSSQFYELIISKETPGNYCIAFGLFASEMQIDKADTLTAFYYNVTAAIVTNCVKLIPLGQMDGQRILHSLHPLINCLVEKTMQPDVELIGKCSSGFDIRSMQHETLYSRLYMS